jgi:NADPH-dependent glutamate synthase beta subunit-like oxidoreductase
MNNELSKTQNASKNHYVAIIGGSVAGSEAASILAEKGYKVVVFDQNELPYGKLEDGLPMWHAKLRDRQEDAIDEKLDKPNIQYIPLVQIGKDVPFDELVNDWGFSAVILANGAWDDRQLPLERIHNTIGDNLVYQNPFLYWFNHKHEPNYNGPVYKIKNNAVVLGGGLASVDVMKIIMMELVMEGLQKKGIKTDVFTLEKKGVKEILDQNGLTLDDIGVKPATLVYRRAAEDMPLAQPSDDTPEKIEKARQTSKKLIEKYIEKFLFNFEPQAVVEDEIFEGDDFKGLVFRRMDITDGKLTPTDETFEIKTGFVIGSIGSIPKKMEGLHYDGERLKMDSDYKVHGYDNVFALGNAITGKGNIMSSKKHGREMTARIIDEHLDDLLDLFNTDALEEKVKLHNKAIEDRIGKQITGIEKSILAHSIITESEEKCLLDKTSQLNEEHDFSTYKRWIKEHKPIRLETLLNLNH